MNTLFRHIEFMLTRHDCVIVPGLGAFIVTSLPAVIDRVNRKITPPSRSVMFNQAVTLDDGLLANSYARHLGLTFEEARQLVLKDVATLLDALHANGIYNAGRLGNFSLGEENQVVFQPAASPVEFAEKCGHYSIILPTPGNTLQPSSESIPDGLTYTSEDNEAENRYFHLRINRSVIRFTAAFAIVAAIALAVIMHPVPRDVREHRASVLPVEALMPSQHQEEQPDITVSQTSAAPEVNQQHVDDMDVSDSTSDSKYFLIVATFHSKKEAERYVQLHSTPEFPLETVSSRKATRVFVSSSSDRKELLEELNSQRISNNFPNAWIWSAKD